MLLARAGVNPNSQAARRSDRTTTPTGGDAARPPFQPCISRDTAGGLAPLDGSRRSSRCLAD